MNKRKAISPVLATVILIAITLIAAIAVTGFIFGLFGSFRNTPQVSAQSTIGSDLTGEIDLYNSGTSPAIIEGVTMTYNGQTCGASYVSTGTVPPNGQAVVTIQAGIFSGGSTYQCGQVGTISVAQAGAQYTGEVTLSGGAQVPFTGVFD